jgi:PleD family two-component response regulator
VSGSKLQILGSVVEHLPSGTFKLITYRFAIRRVTTMSRACGEPGQVDVQQQDVMSSTILLVDDEQDIVETLRYSLEREGYATLSARTARRR